MQPFEPIDEATYLLTMMTLLRFCFKFVMFEL